MLVINEEEDYLRPKESIRTKDSQLGDIERDRLIEHSKRIGINEIQAQLDTKSKTQNQSIKSIEIVGRCYHIA